MICMEEAGMKKVLFRIIIPILILAAWMIMCYPVCARADGFGRMSIWNAENEHVSCSEEFWYCREHWHIGTRLYHWWVDRWYDCYNQNYQYSYGNNKIDIRNFWR